MLIVANEAMAVKQLRCWAVSQEKKKKAVYSVSRSAMSLTHQAVQKHHSHDCQSKQSHPKSCITFCFQILHTNKIFKINKNALPHSVVREVNLALETICLHLPRAAFWPCFLWAEALGYIFVTHAKVLWPNHEVTCLLWQVGFTCTLKTWEVWE